MLMIPFALFAIQSSPIPDIEKEIQKQLDTLSNEIIASLTVCEKECLAGTPERFIYGWLFRFTSERFDDVRYPSQKIVDNISDEMVDYLAKKFKLKLLWIDEFKTSLVLFTVINKLTFQKCSIDKAINDFNIYEESRIPKYEKKVVNTYIEQSSPLSDMEKDIQKQLVALGDEITSSLSDCEKGFLNRAPLFTNWLKAKKNDQFSEKINNSISDEMVRYLVKKHKLKSIKFDEFKLYLVFVATVNFFYHQECPLYEAMNGACVFVENLEKRPVRPIKKTKQAVCKMMQSLNTKHNAESGAVLAAFIYDDLNILKKHYSPLPMISKTRKQE